MEVTTMRQFILRYFQAHAIKGTLKPGRTYKVISQSESQLKISTHARDGRTLQTLSADLVTCRSQKYGEFRRVDLFWGVERRAKDEGFIPMGSAGPADDDDDADRVAVPDPAFAAGGALLPVDAFIARGADRDPSHRSPKEKAS